MTGKDKASRMKTRTAEGEGRDMGMRGGGRVQGYGKGRERGQG